MEKIYNLMLKDEKIDLALPVSDFSFSLLLENYPKMNFFLQKLAQRLFTIWDLSENCSICNILIKESKEILIEINPSYSIISTSSNQRNFWFTKDKLKDSEFSDEIIFELIFCKNLKFLSLKSTNKNLKAYFLCENDWKIEKTFEEEYLFRIKFSRTSTSIIFTQQTLDFHISDEKLSIETIPITYKFFSFTENFCGSIRIVFNSSPINLLSTFLLQLSTGTPSTNISETISLKDLIQTSLLSPIYKYYLNTNLLNTPTNCFKAIKQQLRALSLFFQRKIDPNLIELFYQTNPSTWLILPLSILAFKREKPSIFPVLFDFFSNFLRFLQNHLSDPAKKCLHHTYSILLSWNGIIPNLISNLSQNIDYFTSHSYLISSLDLLSSISQYLIAIDYENLNIFTFSLLTFLQKALNFPVFILYKASSIITSILPYTMETFKELNGINSIAKLIVYHINNIEDHISENYSCFLNDLFKIITYAISKWDSIQGVIYTQIQIIFDSGLIQSIHQIFLKKKVKVYEEIVKLLSQMINEYSECRNDLLSEGVVSNLLESLEEFTPCFPVFIEKLLKFISQISYSGEGLREIDCFNTITKAICALGHCKTEEFTNDIAVNIGENLSELILLVPSSIEKAINGCVTLICALKNFSINFTENFFSQIKNISLLFDLTFKFTPEVISGFLNHGFFDDILDLLRLPFLPNNEKNEFHELGACIKSISFGMASNILFKIFVSVSQFFEKLENLQSNLFESQNLSSINNESYSEIVQILVRIDSHIEMVRIVIVNSNIISKHFEEFSEKIEKISILQKIITSERNRIEHNPNDPHKNQIEIFKICENTIIKLFKASTKISKVKNKNLEDSSIAVIKIIGKIISKIIESFEISENDFIHNNLIHNQMAFIIKIIYPDSLLHLSLLYEFIINNGLLKVFENLENLKIISENAIHNNCSNQFIKSIQCLWTIFGNFFENIFVDNGKNLNKEIEILIMIGCSQPEDLIKSIQFEIFNFLKNFNFYECDEIGKNFANSVIKIVKILVNEQKSSIMNFRFNFSEFKHKEHDDLIFSSESYVEVFRFLMKPEEIIQILAAVTVKFNMFDECLNIFLVIFKNNLEIIDYVMVIYLKIFGIITEEYFYDNFFLNSINKLLTQIAFNKFHIRQTLSCLNFFFNYKDTKFFEEFSFGDWFIIFMKKNLLDEIENFEWLGEGFRLLNTLLELDMVKIEEIFEIFIIYIEKMQSGNRKNGFGSQINLEGFAELILNFTNDLKMCEDIRKNAFFHKILLIQKEKKIKCITGYNSSCSDNEEKYFNFVKTLKNLCESPYVFQNSFLSSLSKFETKHKVPLDYILNCYYNEIKRSKQLFVQLFFNNFVIQDFQNVCMKVVNLVDVDLYENWSSIFEIIDQIYYIKDFKSNRILNKRRLIQCLLLAFKESPILILDFLGYFNQPANNTRKNFIKDILFGEYCLKIENCHRFYTKKSTNHEIPSQKTEKWLNLTNNFVKEIFNYSEYTKKIQGPLQQHQEISILFIFSQISEIIFENLNKNWNDNPTNLNFIISSLDLLKFLLNHSGTHSSELSTKIRSFINSLRMPKFLMLFNFHSENSEFLIYHLIEFFEIITNPLTLQKPYLEQSENKTEIIDLENKERNISRSSSSYSNEDSFPNEEDEFSEYCSSSIEENGENCEISESEVSSENEENFEKLSKKISDSINENIQIEKRNEKIFKSQIKVKEVFREIIEVNKRLHREKTEKLDLAQNFFECRKCAKKVENAHIIIENEGKIETNKFSERKLGSNARELDVERTSLYNFFENDDEENEFFNKIGSIFYLSHDFPLTIFTSFLLNLSVSDGLCKKILLFLSNFLLSLDFSELYPIYSLKIIEIINHMVLLSPKVSILLNFTSLRNENECLFGSIMSLLNLSFYKSSITHLNALLCLISNILSKLGLTLKDLPIKTLDSFSEILIITETNDKTLSHTSEILEKISKLPDLKQKVFKSLNNSLKTLAFQISNQLKQPCLDFPNNIKAQQFLRICKLLKNSSGYFIDFDFLWDSLTESLSSTSFSDLSEMPHLSPLLSSILPILESFFICLYDKVNSKTFQLFSEQNHKTINLLIRQSPRLLHSTFNSLIIRFPSLLDFENKRNYFRSQMREVQRNASHDVIRLHVRRQEVFMDSYHQLKIKSASEMYSKLRIQFVGEEGLDAGGLTREWYGLLARTMFNPNYALFIPSANGVSFQPNSMSSINAEHIQFFKFVGRIIGKALCDGYPLDLYFTRSFYKHILGQEVNYQDMEDLDIDFYKSLKSLMDINLNESELHEYYFAYEEEEFGKHKIKELVPNGKTKRVTEENKIDYIKLLCHMKMTKNIQAQIDAFKSGFHELIPIDLISIFDSKELELLISGLPEVDLEDLQANTDYHNYTKNSQVIVWLWEVLYEFSHEEIAEFLQFVTGSSKVPLEGFKALSGMGGLQKFQIHKSFTSHDRLPTAHTCMNQLDLPEYPTKEKLKNRLKLAISEGKEGFGFI